MDRLQALKVSLMEQLAVVKAAAVSAKDSVQSYAVGMINGVWDQGVRGWTGVSAWTVEMIHTTRDFANEIFFSTQKYALGGFEAARRSALESKERASTKTKEIYTTAIQKAEESKEQASLRARKIYTTARRTAGESTDFATTKAKELYSATGELVADDSFKAAAAGAATGAVALGAGGAAAGLATGGIVGTAVGLLAAPLTLGLSIPIGAVIGGGTGVAVGAAAGGTAGLVSGGAAGYGVHSKKDDIQAFSAGVRSKAEESASLAKAKLGEGASFAKTRAASAWESVSTAKAKLVGGATAAVAA